MIKFPPETAPDWGRLEQIQAVAVEIAVTDHPNKRHTVGMLFAAYVSIVSAGHPSGDDAAMVREALRAAGAPWPDFNDQPGGAT